MRRALVRYAGMDDVLQVGLHEKGPVAEAENVGPLQRDFLLLHADARVELLSGSLAAAEVVAELAVNDAEGGHIAVAA